MQHLLIVWLLVGVCTFMPGAQTSVHATTITYTATDLNDILGPGGDFWEYRYTVSGQSFAPDMGFSIVFTLGRYSDLEAPPVNGDWDVVAFQPDPSLPDDGFYDALALVNNATLTDPFVARFVWLGGSLMVPGAQAFLVYTLDSGGALQGSVIADIDGTRQATLLIPQGTQAQVYNANGTTRSVTTLTLRLTEWEQRPFG